MDWQELHDKAENHKRVVEALDDEQKAVNLFGPLERDLIKLVFLVFQLKLKEESRPLHQVVARVHCRVFGDDPVVLELAEVQLLKHKGIVFVLRDFVRKLFVVGSIVLK